MRSIDPDSEENQKATRDNERATFAAMAEGGMSCQAAFDNVSKGHGFPYVPEDRREIFTAFGVPSDWFSTVERVLKLETVAESWRGTPFMPNAAVKGSGVSCQKLVTAIYKECGHLPPEFECEEGPMCWSRAQKESLIEKFMAKQTRFFAAWDMPSAKPHAGDMLGFKLDGCVHHCGVMLSGGKFIHCWMRNGVMISQIHDAAYWTRLARIWRPIQSTQ